MYGARRTGSWALLFLFASITLAGVSSGFAQGQNGILTGIAADGNGVVPGATVTATDPTIAERADFAWRTGPRPHRGLQSPGCLPRPVGTRRSLHTEIRNGRVQQITLNEVMVVSGETRDLGRLVLEVGPLDPDCTKSGSTQLKGSGWYNARRDEWNANDYFRKKQGAEKPFFEVDISGYSSVVPW